MSAVTYRTVLISDLPPDVAEANDIEVDEDSCRAVIVRERDGVIDEVLAFDGGEPEDNSFFRDGRWIAPALNAAFKLGMESR